MPATRSLNLGFASFLLISIAIHVMLLATISFQKVRTSKEDKKIIELVEIRKEQGTGSKLMSLGSNPTSRKSSSRISSESLEPKQNPVVTGKKYFGSKLTDLLEKSQDGIHVGDSFLKHRKMDNPSAPWGQGAGTFERVEDLTLFQRLFQKIDSSLSYPGVLSRHKIEGTVNARFVLAQNGSCDWKHTQILGTDPYLRLYVLDLLKRICSENFSRYLNGRMTTNVDLSFTFAVSENGSKDYRDERQMIVGNTMLFFRNHHHSVLEWELGPFRGMFPIPAAYLNIQWIQENWERLIENKDPIKEFKKEFG